MVVSAVCFIVMTVIGLVIRHDPYDHLLKCVASLVLVVSHSTVVVVVVVVVVRDGGGATARDNTTNNNTPTQRPHRDHTVYTTQSETGCVLPSG